jgi:sec-independent protein translocase protein TatB
MFDVGFSELLLIGLVALMVLGPKRLPEAARAAGQWAARIRRFIADVKQDLDREMHQAELDELRQLKHELDETRRVMQDASGKLLGEFTGTAPTIHSELAPTPPAAVPVKRLRSAPRTRRLKPSVSGKKHGQAKKTRRR